MNLLDPVSNIMTPNPITLTPEDSIKEAAKIFNEKKVHHIPIIEEGKLAGIVSMSDFLFFRRGFLDNSSDIEVENVRMNNYQVSYIMTKGIARLAPDERINVALEIFKENLFHAIPIVDNDELVGIVTTYDIIKNLAIDKEAHATY